MSLVPSLQLPHNPNSKCVHAHGFRTCATPTFGSIVVKGKFPVATLVCVAAEKNPLKDIEFVHHEFDAWFTQLLKR